MEDKKINLKDSETESAEELSDEELGDVNGGVCRAVSTDMMASTHKSQSKKQPFLQFLKNGKKNQKTSL